MQGDVVSLAAQVLLAQRRPGVRQVDVGAEKPHRCVSVVFAERPCRGHPGRPAAHDDQSAFGHYRVVPTLDGLNRSVSEGARRVCAKELRERSTGSFH
jgi:hypothetical protein